MQDSREQNAAAMRFRREIVNHAQWSPYRLKQYVDARLA